MSLAAAALVPEMADGFEVAPLVGGVDLAVLPVSGALPEPEPESAALPQVTSSPTPETTAPGTATTPTPTAPATATATAAPTATGSPTEGTATGQPTPTATTGETAPEPEPTASEQTPQETASTTIAPEPDPEPEDTPIEPAATTPFVGVDWYHPPASHHSGISTPSVVVAIVVLIGVALGMALVRRHRAKLHSGGYGEQAVREPTGEPALGAGPGGQVPDAAAEAGADRTLDMSAGEEAAGETSDIFADLERTAGEQQAPEATATRAEPDELLGFLVLLGEALVDCSSPIAQVQRVLADVTEVTGHPEAEVIVLPTAVLVTVPGATGRTVAAKAGMRSLRLDQTEDVLHLAEQVRSGRLRLGAATAQLERVLRSPAPFAPWVQVVGYGLYSLGLSLILGGGLPDLMVAALLGLGLGAAKTYLFSRAGLDGIAADALVVLGSAFAVGVVVLATVRWSPVEIGVLPTLVPPLVSYLPGALLTTGVIDLATRQIIAGSSRLASGLMQVVLLAMGVMAAASLVGVRADRISDTVTGLGPVGAWTGVVLFTCGVWLYHCVRTRSMPWVLLVVTVAHAGQVIGGLLFGGVISAFVGAALMMPVALYAATRPSGPPAMLSFLPGFWVLVPGALAVVGLTQSLEDRALGEGTLWTAGGTMVSVSLGVLVGLALWHVAEMTRVAVTGREGQRTPL